MNPKNTEITDIGCTHVTAAVQILGDKWTAHIIRVLAEGPLRFSQIQDEAGGINPRTLSERLARLEHCGVLAKCTSGTEPPRASYGLTEKGRDLLPILQAMAAWGTRYAEPE